MAKCLNFQIGHLKHIGKNRPGESVRLYSVYCLVVFVYSLGTDVKLIPSTICIKFDNNNNMAIVWSHVYFKHKLAEADGTFLTCERPDLIKRIISFNQVQAKNNNQIKKIISAHNLITDE